MVVGAATLFYFRSSIIYPHPPPCNLISHGRRPAIITEAPRHPLWCAGLSLASGIDCPQNVDIASSGLHWPASRLLFPHSCHWCALLRYSSSISIPCPVPLCLRIAAIPAWTTRREDLQADMSLTSIRPLLPLRARRRAHRFCKEAPHAPHFRRHCCPTIPRARRRLSMGTLGAEHSQPRRVPAEPATLPSREVDRSHIHRVLRSVPLRLTRFLNLREAQRATVLRAV